MRDTAHPIEANIVLGGHPAQTTFNLLAQACGLCELEFEGAHRLHGQGQQASDAPRTGERAWVGALAFIDCPPSIDFTQSVMQGFNEQGATLGVVEQIVLQIGITLHDPDIAQHLVQHARRSARSTFRTELVDDLPALFAEQTRDNFAVGKGGVVVGDLAQAPV